MEIDLAHVLLMNVIQVMCLKVRNIDIVKVTCGGVPAILCLIVRKKVLFIEYDILVLVKMIIDWCDFYTSKLYMCIEISIGH